jgi:signal transduction histidine kinase
VAFKIWDTSGRVLYSTDTETIGRTFPMHEKLQLAQQGNVASGISDLEEQENLAQQALRPRLLETYSPIRLSGSNQIIAVAEFYQTIDDLQQEIRVARRASWWVVGVAMLAMYLLLAGFVQRASDTIVRQQAELNHQVTRLTDLLAQNQELHTRVRRAAASVATLNEGFLRRIGAELHDGPAQDLSLALLRLDTVIGCCESGQGLLDSNAIGSNAIHGGPGPITHLRAIQTSLEHALQEIRSIAAGLNLPHLGDLSLVETITRAVRAHVRRTGTKVALRTEGLPEQSTLPIRITVYRVIQEALNNAYRHAGGAGQQVWVTGSARHVQVEVSDQGPGFVMADHDDANGHLGLLGMRERVESQGGRFQIESIPGHGTRVRAWLALPSAGDSDERD